MLPLAFLGSPADIGIILVLALIIFGPKKLPEVGKQLGQAMRELRKVTDELTGAVHSVHNEVESVYKPVLSPPHEYGNPYQSTSSPTVEKVMTHPPYDQAPEDLMGAKELTASKDLLAPAVLPASHSEALAETPDSTDVKGH